MKTAVIVDSTAYLNGTLAQHPDVYTIHLSVNFSDGTVLEDTADPQLLQQFYQRLKTEAQLPTTSQPQPGAYMALLNQLIEAGYQAVYCIHLSSGISGTYQTACMITEEYQDKLKCYVIDSGSACMVMSTLVGRAAQWIEAGEDPELIYRRLQWSAQHADIYLMVEDLNNLAKGGRLSAASALLGGILQIRPLLHFENGQIVLAEKIRTSKKVYRRFVELVGEWQTQYPQGVTVVLGEANSYEELQLIRQMLEEAYPTVTVHECAIGPVVGTHTGGGTKGLGLIPWVPAELA